MSLYNAIKAQQTSGRPKYYRSHGFRLVCLMVTAIAGGPAIAESAGNPLPAVNIGASAPAILQLPAKPPEA